MVSMQSVTRAFLLALGCIAGPVAALAQGRFNMELLSQTNEFGGGRGAYAACWGYSAPDGTELALIGQVNGTDIYDVTDGRSPLLLTSIPGPRSQWREMQTWSHYAYVVTEGTPAQGERGGVQIIDLGNPRFPAQIGNFDSTVTTGHTIHVAEGFAYVNGGNNGNGIHILDLADPEHPREVGGWHTRYVHDCYVRGNRAFLANINAGGFTILDLTDKSQPQELSFTAYSGAATHNCWLNDDGHYLFTTDETGGGHLRVWNVQNPRSPAPAAEWSAHSSTSIHNVVVRGDSAYIAYYTEGVQVVDVSQPSAPRLVGFFDTYPGASGGYAGCWGVYPLAQNHNIIASDMQGGLFVLRMGTGGQPVVDFVVDAPPAIRVQPGQASALLFFDIYNGSGSAQLYDLAAVNDLGWNVDVAPTITVPRGGIEAVLVTVSVPANLPGPARAQVELCVTQHSTGFQVCKATRVAVPVTLQDLTATVRGPGIELQWRLQRDVEDAGALEIQRAQLDGASPLFEPEFATVASLTGREMHWLDAAVDPGAAYRYRFLWSDGGGVRVLSEIDAQAAAPGRSRLLGATPNPFNPSTRIRFELAHAGGVEITIHDARGRLVRRLVAADLEPGEHALVWDGRDARGTAQSSGLYLYEVRGASWAARGRVTLAK